jgi:hypothetical protein
MTVCGGLGGPLARGPGGWGRRRSIVIVRLDHLTGWMADDGGLFQARKKACGGAPSFSRQGAVDSL